MISQLDLANVSQSLQACELFSGLTAKQLTKVLPLCSVETWREGTTLFNQGAEADAIYVITKGGVEITMRRNPLDDERGIVVDRVGTGRVIGWSSLVEPYVYTAAGRATMGTAGIEINGVSLRRLLETDHELGVQIYKRLTLMLGRRLTQVYGVLDSLL